MTYATYAEAKEHQGVRGPIHWFGGKGLLVSKLVRLLPESWDAYVEPFVGGGSLFFRLPRAEVEVINDIDTGLMDLYWCLAGDDTFRRFLVLAEFTPYSRRLWRECRDHWAEVSDPVERAWAWWLRMRQTFGGAGNLRAHGGWGYVVSGSARTLAESLRAAVRRLPAVHERLQGVRIECCDGVELVARHGDPATFMYCDPPYVQTARRSGRYQCEMSLADHERLVNALLRSPARIMVSGYDNDLYRRLDEAGWHRAEFVTVCYAAGHTWVNGVLSAGAAKRQQPRVEVVWRNYRRRDALAVQEALPDLAQGGTK